MFSNFDLTHCPVPQAFVLGKHISYLRMIRLLDTEFNGLCCYRPFFYFAVCCVAGIREIFVYSFNFLDIDFALFAVRVLFGYAE